MTSPQQPGILFTGNYRVVAGNPGVPGAPSVLDELANPPATAVQAQTDGKAAQAALGVVKTAAFQAATKVASSHYDKIKNFYDGAGVVGIANNNPLS
jgi:hypothetical protein